MRAVHLHPGPTARAARTTAMLVLAVSLTGCTRGEHPGVPTPVRSTALAGSPPASDPEDLRDSGRYDVLVERVDPGRGTVTVDVVQYFSGTAAARACAQDGIPDQRGPLCRDFYLRDRSSRLWTVHLRAGAVITIRAEGCGPGRPTALRRLVAGLAGHRLFRLDLAEGAATRLTESCAS